MGMSLLFLIKAIIYQSIFPNDLIAPVIQTATPAAAKRVKRYIGSSGLYYSLYLPSYWASNKRKYRCIFDSPGNIYNPYNGTVDDPILGYGITGGQYVWVVAPFLNTNGTASLNNWWGTGTYTSEAQATVDYWLLIIDDLITNFNVDPNHIVLTGFSRGAIACHHIGCYNDTIAAKWKAFIPFAHMDAGTYATIDSPTRLARTNNRKTLVLVGVNDELSTINNSKAGRDILLSYNYPTEYIEINGYGHSPNWSLLGNNQQTVYVRNWIFNLK